MDKSKIAVGVFDKLAKQYQDKFMDVSLYSSTFDFFCDNIKGENPDVLELACGPGNITNYLLNKRPDLKILGTDLAPNMIRLAEMNNPGAQFSVMDCRNIRSIEKLYHAIMCGFCLPYLSEKEVEKLISDASQLLLAGGLFYISTMEDDYNKSGFRKGSAGDEIYMHYYMADYLSSVLRKNNFEILLTERKKSLMTDGSEVTDLVLIAGKQC